MRRFNMDGPLCMRLLCLVTRKSLKLLIANDADVNAWDGYETPLDVSDDESEIADLLRKHGGKTGEELKAKGK